MGRVRSVPANGSTAPITLSLQASRWATRELERRGCDVIHLHEPLTPVLGWPTLWRHKVGIVATFHRAGSDPIYRCAGRVLGSWAHRIDAAAAVSTAAAATARECLGLEATILFNGVDLGAIDAAEPWPTKGPTVLFVGRDEPRKGRDVLLAAARLLPESVTLWVTGSPPERKTHIAGASIEFLGVIDDTERDRRLRGADVLCAPSRGGESFGMVLLEAMAASTAVVASDIEGYREALDGHGTLVAPDDPVQLAGALTAALFPVGPDALAAARQHASRWSISALVDRYEPLYARARRSRVSSAAQ